MSLILTDTYYDASGNANLVSSVPIDTTNSQPIRVYGVNDKDGSRVNNGNLIFITLANAQSAVPTYSGPTAINSTDGTLFTLEIGHQLTGIIHDLNGDYVLNQFGAYVTIDDVNLASPTDNPLHYTNQLVNVTNAIVYNGVDYNESSVYYLAYGPITTTGIFLPIDGDSVTLIGDAKDALVSIGNRLYTSGTFEQKTDAYAQSVFASYINNKSIVRFRADATDEQAVTNAVVHFVNIAE